MIAMGHNSIEARSDASDQFPVPPENSMALILLTISDNQKRQPAWITVDVREQTFSLPPKPGAIHTSLGWYRQHGYILLLRLIRQRRDE